MLMLSLNIIENQMSINGSLKSGKKTGIVDKALALPPPEYAHISLDALKSKEEAEQEDQQEEEAQQKDEQEKVKEVTSPEKKKRKASSTNNSPPKKTKKNKHE